MGRALMLVVLIGFVGLPSTQASAADAQKPSLRRKSAAPKRSAPPGAVELSQRLAAAQAARQSGNPQSVVKANRRLLALGLRDMAQLRFRVDSFREAVELFKRSLELEDLADSRVDLAITYLRLRQATDTLEEAEKATLQAPQNARAWNVKGKSWMMLKNYRNAAQSLARSLSLQGDMEAAYSLATCLLALKEKDKAALLFRDMLQTAGESGSMHVLFGRAYRDANYMADAQREMRRALAINPKTAHAHYFLGLIGLIGNEWAPSSEIKQEMREELKQYPRDYMANYLLGVMASNEKQFESSDSYLRTATREQPNSPELWLYLGLNAYGRGDGVKAEELLRKAIDLTGSEESRSHYQIRKAYIALGRILIQSGRHEEAAKWMAKAREMQQLGLVESQQKIAEVFSTSKVGMGAVMPYVSPENEEKAVPLPQFVDATAQLSISALARAKLTGKEKELALRQEKQLREILGTGYNDLGTAEARQKQYAEALAHFLEAERWAPEIPGLTRNLGIAAAKVGDHATVIRALSKQVAATPDDRVARAMLGVSYYWTQAYTEAANAILPLGEAALNDPGLAYPLAESLAKTGRVREATNVLDRLEKQPLSAESLLLVGQEWLEVGDPSRAATALHRAAEQDPALLKAHYYAGIAFIRQGRPAEAATEFLAELDRSPDDADAKYNLGYAYLLQSQREKAMPLFEAVIASHPEHAEAQYQLGKLLLDQEQIKGAIGHLEAAVRLNPGKDFVHYQLQAAYRKDGRIEDADRELALYKEIKARNRERTIARPNQDQEDE